MKNPVTKNPVMKSLLTYKFPIAAAALASAALLPFSGHAAEPEKGTDVDIQGHVVKPAKKTPEVADLDKIKLPEGFKIEPFATGLINPRMLVAGTDGTVYATRRSVGDVVMLRDEDSDGRADIVKTVASRPDIHGITLDGGKAYLVTVHDIYVADVKSDGTFGELKRIVDDLPDAGQHPNRTIAMGPDGMLYVSVGSTCNACAEPNPENATMLQVRPNGSFRKIMASGLRNTIGFGWQPETGEMWGFDHGIDWLGNEDQKEELNRLMEGKKYGWPYIYDKASANPADAPPGDLTHEDWAKASEGPVLTYTAHAAPMQMAFYTGDAFPEAYRGDAFVAMHGSWNRKPPSGYEVVRVDFEDGQPKAIEPFITGFLQQDGGNYQFIGRPVGVAVSPDGALYVADDSNGTVYRVTYEAEDSGKTSVDQVVDSVVDAVTPDSDRPASKNAALKKVEKTDEISIQRTDAPKQDHALEPASPAFHDGEAIPHRYSAYGEDISPEIRWKKGPEGTRSYVVMVEDPDAATPKPFAHWVLYNLPAEVTSLPEGVPGTVALEQPKAMQGANDRGSTGYFGPKPPADGPHHYHFQVFALDKMLDLKAGADRDAVLEAMKGHVLAKDELVGTFEKPKPSEG